MLLDVIKGLSSPRSVSFDNRLMEAFMEGNGSSQVLEVPGVFNGWVRASGLHGFCPRLVAISIVDGIQFIGSIDRVFEWILALGTGIHSGMQNVFLPNRLKERFLGKWMCTGCGKVYGTDEEPIPRPEERCCKEDEAGYLYKEIIRKNEEYRIRCHLDGLIRWDDGDEILEMKSINDRGYKWVCFPGGPKPEHVIQNVIYQWLTGVKRGRVVYIEKSSRNIPEVMAEQVIAYDQSIVDGAIPLLVAWKKFVDERVMPGRLLECQQNASSRLNKCLCKMNCLERE